MKAAELLSISFYSVTFIIADTGIMSLTQQSEKSAQHSGSHQYAKQY